MREAFVLLAGVRVRRLRAAMEGPSKKSSADSFDSRRPRANDRKGREKSDPSGDGYRLRVILPFGFAALAVVGGLFVLFRMALQKPKSASHASLPAETTFTPEPPPVIGPLPAAERDEHLARSHTTMTILSEQGKDCLDCAERSGCLDAKQHGNPCEGASGFATGCGEGVTETEMCIRTLMGVFSSKCAATLQQVPCLCGATDAEECLRGTTVPTGPLYRDYACDFKTTDVGAIQANFRETKYGVGLANTIVQCVAESECTCFGSEDKN
jgi:hypothetical protein